MHAQCQYKPHECWWCRAAGGFVGIKNGGATCYMNSLFQQLFMQPSIRAFLMAGPETPAAARDDSVFYQLQVGSDLRSPVFTITCD